MELAKEVSRIPFVVVGCKQDVRNDCAQSMTVPKDEVYIMIFESVFIYQNYNLIFFINLSGQASYIYSYKVMIIGLQQE